MQLARKQVPPSDFKGLQDRGGASQNAYKHNAFLMIPSAFSRIARGNGESTTGFIRVRRLYCGACEKAGFPPE